MIHLRHRLLCALLLPLLLAASAVAQTPAPLPDRASELRQQLRQLQTTARLLQTTAHPDDEDGGMLTLEARGHGAEVTLLTLTRGEGGQNKLGSSLLDSLGVLRTLELLAADKYYGVEQRFTRVADFGFSKTAEETFAKWHGHDAALADMVRVVRTFRPDVIVARFSGTPRDGHGHHQASAILTREAFHAAADPNRFPEQIKEGLQPWQARKLYLGNVRPFGSTAPIAPDAYTLALDSGVPDTLLGMTYAQYANQGLKHQLSQGAEAWNVGPGPHLSYYKLVESVLPMPKPGEHEKDFFDGIDTSLSGLAARLGVDDAQAPGLRQGLADLQESVAKAAQAAEHDPTAAGIPLLTGVKITGQIINTVQKAQMAPASKQDLLSLLGSKRQQLQKAASLALGLELQATVDAPVATSPQAAFVAVPGETVRVNAILHNGGTRAITAEQLRLVPANGWQLPGAQQRPSEVPPAGELKAEYAYTPGPHTELTRPYWHRENPETDTVYTLDQPQYATLPFAPPPLLAKAEYAVDGLRGEISATVTVPYRDGSAVKQMPLAIVPPLSVSVTPGAVVLPLAKRDGTKLVAAVRKQGDGNIGAELRVQAPPGWRNAPATVAMPMDSASRGGAREFGLAPAQVNPGRSEARAVATANGRVYGEGYTVITRPDLNAALYYQPAVERISVVDVKVPCGLKVGYLMGAGDDIPTVLQQIGLDVTTVGEPELASGDLGRYGAIVLGIRAYDTRKDVRAHNQRLLDYVQQGGTLLVQYNSGVADFNAGHYAPFPAQLSRERVSVEEAPVEMLDPQHPVFHFPNAITARDFAGWVQERGLYFMSDWDAHFTPLLSCHDPDEPPQRGGLLVARYGKGTYVYTGYSFFRQLPAGVPGAVRLFVNLVSAGHEQQVLRTGP